MHGPNRRTEPACSPREPDAWSTRLLDDCLAVAGRRSPEALSATALRTGSVAARRVLARAACRSLSLEELIQAAHADASPTDLDVAAAAELAGVVGLQELLQSDVDDAVRLYDLALRHGGARRIPARHQGTHAQLAWRLGERERVRRLLKVYKQMPDQVAAALRLDLDNPFDRRDEALVSPEQTRAWLRGLEALLAPRDHAATPRLTVHDDAELPAFDRLRADPVPAVDAAEKITVIVTAYRPDEGLITSVRSLITQSWQNLEILVVDDASPPQYDEVLRRCVDLDDRVKLITMDSNGGTYVARNAAFDVAAGDFVTFQDSDDWAHPLRVERQVRAMLQDPGLAAVVSDALGVDDQLVVTRPGRLLQLLCTPSLMFRRRAVLPRLGYMDSIRKAADTEFLRRIEADFGRGSVLRLRDGAYTLMRQSAGSLSRAEFRSGWRHPARHAYQSAYKPWHEAIAAGTASPYLDKRPTARPFAAPARYTDEPGRGYDVVFACDWRPFGGPQKSMLEEIAALRDRGLRTAVMHLESYRHMTAAAKPLCAPVQELINSGDVGQVLPDDAAEVSLLVTRYPPVLQYRVGERLGFTPEKAIVLANQAPCEQDGSDRRYVPSQCHHIAREFFGVEPTWVPQGPMVRAALADELDATVLSDVDVPGVVDVGDMLPRQGFRSDVPVLGRHARDDWTKWPADRAALLRQFPSTSTVDVRIMGGAKSAEKLLGTATPPNWIVYQPGDLDVDNFLRQLDFYVYFPHPTMIEAFGRAVVEALAAGCVTILPQRFEETFEDAALYCLPEEVPWLVQDYYRRPAAYLAQSRLAQQRVRENFSHDSYVAKIADWLPSETPLKGPD